MTADVFVDTNVLVYAHDASEPVKQPLAEAWYRALWQSRRGRVSVQVLNEYYHTVTRKLRPGRNVTWARAEVRALGKWKPIPLQSGAVERAWLLQDRFALSYWDALIVATAQIGHCRYLLTEDLQEGQDLGGVIVLNPFLHLPNEVG